jgi:hypothetical protein
LPQSTGLEHQEPVRTHVRPSHRQGLAFCLLPDREPRPLRHGHATAMVTAHVPAPLQCGARRCLWHFTEHPACGLHTHQPQEHMHAHMHSSRTGSGSCHAGSGRDQQAGPDCQWRRRLLTRGPGLSVEGGEGDPEPTGQGASPPSRKSSQPT